MKQLLVLLLLQSIALISSATPYKEVEFDFFPGVQSGTVGKKQQTKTITNPCSILFKLTNKYQNYDHIKELLHHYQLKSFECSSLNLFVPEVREKSSVKENDYTVIINIIKPELKSAFNTSEQKYNLKITKEQAEIKAETYVGFVRGIQTFYQSIACTENKRVDCSLSHLPIQVEDFPEFEHRGLMIDTAKHYLPVKIILQTIDGMMYNKMNVLHWHITDDDSFPLVLKSHPQLAQSGAFSQEQVYTIADVKAIVHYGLVRGVRIVPQIPTPSHSASWAKKYKHQNLLACKRNKAIPGGLNIFLNQTMDLIKDVFAEVFELFPDPLVHLGGESLHPSCLHNSKQKLNDDMKKLKVKESDIESSLAYRKQQRKILKQLNSSKSLIYWESQKFEGQMDDIVHWHTSNLPNGSNNKIIFTKDMIFHLETGVGHANGTAFGQYNVWPRLYQDNLVKQIENSTYKDKVLGAEVLLWGETSNQYTHHIKIWMRASTVAERLWNSKIEKIRYSVWRRLARHGRIMDQRGIPYAPITCQQCEYHPEAC